MELYANRAVVLCKTFWTAPKKRRFGLHPDTREPAMNVAGNFKNADRKAT
jgi:hypothetical protein